MGSGVNKKIQPVVWRLKAQPESQQVQGFKAELGGRVDDLIIRLLLQRGVQTFDQAKTFFNPALGDLHNPFLMKGMNCAVDRILQALEKGESILIYGDYDVDGTTAVALVYRFLSRYCDRVSHYIPDRHKEGYGLSKAGIDFAWDNGFSLLIALDCGTKAIDKVRYAREKSIDMIICDHHTPGETLPRAVAVLNPKQSGDAYPYRELSGCGVGFKLVQALATRLSRAKEEVFGYLDLVAISIAADIVPITGENRILMHFGLQNINDNPCTGVQALMRFSEKERFAVRDLVFVLAPRINAAGRMDHGSLAVDLLTETHPEKARDLASRIDLYNRYRRDLDQRTKAAAIAQIFDRKEESRMSNVVFSPDWHKGVIGIVASKIVEERYKPTVVFTESDGRLVASARSVPGFDLYEALAACSDEMLQFGGHRQAAGLTIAPSKYERFKQKFESVVSTRITADQKIPILWADAEIKLRDIHQKQYRALARFAPFGPGNERPVFWTKGLKAGGRTKRVGQAGAHLKLQVFEPDSAVFYPGIAFGQGDWFEKVRDGRDFDLLYSIELNAYDGTNHLQLVIRDIKRSDETAG
ncbi:MAG: single-stranded-DNA-specific exonuclease RecJ [Flavobacteriales bacterium]